MGSLKQIFFIFSVIFPVTFLSLDVSAQNDNISARARSVVNNNIQTNQAFIQSTTAVREAEGSETASPTINEGADTGKKSQSAGQMMNMLASAGLFAACAASCPKCRMELCAMGALAAMQGAAQGQAAGESGLTYDSSKYNPGDLGPSGDGSGFQPDPSINDGLNKLKASGFKVSEKGVVFPDGSFQPASAFDSPEAMLAAGMDPGSASLAGDVLSAINSELSKITGGGSDGARVASMAVDSASGGYSTGGGGSGDSGGFNYSLSKLKNPFDNKDSKNLLAGKSLMVGGEPIGVKGDNLFDMIHRAYQNKRKRDQFLETVGATKRLPASQASGGL